MSDDLNRNPGPQGHSVQLARAEAEDEAEEREYRQMVWRARATNAVTLAGGVAAAVACLLGMCHG